MDMGQEGGQAKQQQLNSRGSDLGSASGASESIECAFADWGPVWFSAGAYTRTTSWLSARVTLKVSRRLLPHHAALIAAAIDQVAEYESIRSGECSKCKPTAVAGSGRSSGSNLRPLGWKPDGSYSSKFFGNGHVYREADVV